MVQRRNNVHVRVHQRETKLLFTGLLKLDPQGALDAVPTLVSRVPGHITSPFYGS